MFLRYFIVFVVISAIIITALWFVAKEAKNESSKILDPKERAKVIGADAISQLEKILDDPMKIGDPEWEKESKYIIQKWGNSSQSRKKPY